MTYIFNQVDVDGSGAVEWDEFCVLMYKKMREKDPENEIKEAFRQDRVVMVSSGVIFYFFRVFDPEGAGFIGKVG